MAVRRPPSPQRVRPASPQRPPSRAPPRAPQPGPRSRPYSPPRLPLGFLSGNQAVLQPTVPGAPPYEIPPPPPTFLPLRSPSPTYAHMGSPQHSGRTGSPPKRSISPVRKDPNFLTHDPTGPSKRTGSPFRPVSPQHLNSPRPLPQNNMQAVQPLPMPGAQIRAASPIDAPVYARAGGSFANPLSGPPVGTFRDPNIPLPVPVPVAQPAQINQSVMGSLVPPPSGGKSYEHYTRQKKALEKLKAEAQAIREARELEFLQAHKELESLKMQQAVDSARLESKKRECEQGIERLRLAQRQAELSLQRLKAERESTRQKEEETNRLLNSRLAELEHNRESARQGELEEIRRRIREQTARQHELQTQKMGLLAGRKENDVWKKEHESMLRLKEAELSQKESKLTREWEDIERRRLALEALARGQANDSSPVRAKIAAVRHVWSPGRGRISPMADGEQVATEL